MIGAAVIGAVPARTTLRRRAGVIALVLAVLAVHACVTDTLAVRMESLDAESAMPRRLEVAYVREMALTAPVIAATPRAAPRLERSRPKAVPGAPPASAAEAQPEALATIEAEAASPATATAVVTAAAASSAASGADPAVLPDPAASAAPGDAPPFVWPASTRMSYWLTGNYRGPVTGSAQVEWIHEGPRYQVHLDLVIGPEFAPIITRRMSSDGQITEAGLAPQRYDQETKVMLRDRSRSTIMFEPEGVLLANGERRTAMPGLQDTASQFVQLTYVFSTRPDMLRVGSVIEVPLALPRALDMWVYDVIGEETLYTPFGALDTLHLKPRPRAHAEPGELRAEIWFAPQLRYLPVRIRIEQDAETFVDLMISKRPELGAP